MKVYFEDQEYELTKELIKKLETESLNRSDDYDNYILSIEWDDEHQCPRLYMDGPWEC